MRLALARADSMVARSHCAPLHRPEIRLQSDSVARLRYRGSQETSLARHSLLRRLLCASVSGHFPLDGGVQIPLLGRSVILAEVSAV
jgi:hypothetical protein